mmetsp:Transcript_69914/g.195545  ORF Transcript_69914/g.195545 Transcript_69914/m.195545 type:complete len:83 (-) Transcript_69914:616-864(-)
MLVPSLEMEAEAELEELRYELGETMADLLDLRDDFKGEFEWPSTLGRSRIASNSRGSITTPEDIGEIEAGLASIEQNSARAD